MPTTESIEQLKMEVHSSQMLKQFHWVYYFHPGVAFDRSVKVQFSSDAIECNALIINGAARVIGATVAEVPSVSIDGDIILDRDRWYNATVQ